MLFNFIIVFIIFLFLLRFFYIKPKEDIIDTSETNVLLILILFVLAFWITFITISGIQLFINGINLDIDFEYKLLFFILSIFLIYPIFSVYYFYKKYNDLLFEELQINERPDLEKFNKYKKKIELLSRNLNIKNPPKLKISNIHNISPLVFGIFKKSFLILPYNFDAILEEVSDGNAMLQNDLFEFNIVHELSHAFNKDIPLISFIKFLLSREHFFYWTMILFSFQILSLFFIPISISNYFFFNWIVLFPLLITFVLLNWILSDIYEYRQNYADARASLFIDSKRIERLTTKMGITNLTPIEKMFRYFRRNTKYYHSPSRPRFINKSLINVIKLVENEESTIFKNIKIKLFKLFNVKDINLERNKNISGRKFLHETTFTLDSRFSIYHGLSTSILFYISFFIINYIFYSNIKSSINISILFIFIIIIYTAALFFFPLRNSVNRNFEQKEYLKGIFSSHLLSFVFFIVLSILFLIQAFLLKKTNIEAKIILNFLMFIIPIYPSSLFLVLLLSGGIAGENFSSKTKKDMYSAGFYQVLLLILFSITFFKLFPTFNVYDFFSCFFIGMILIFLFKPIGGSLGESYLSWNFYKFKFHIDNLKNNQLRKNIILFFYSIFFGITIFIFPTILTLIIWDLSHLSILISTQYKVISLLAVILVLSIIVSSSKPKIIGPLNGTTSLYKVIKKKIPEKIKKNVINKLEYLKRPDGGYQNRAIFVPYYSDIIETFKGANIEYFLNNIISDSTLEYILSCQNDSGGFGIVPKTYSRLKSTYFGIHSLWKTQQLEKINEKLQDHIRWITSCQTNNGYFMTVQNGNSQLEETFYAISSLDILNTLDSIDKDKCLYWLIKQKEILKHDIEDVFYFVKILHILQGLSKEIKQEIIKNHFLYLEKKAINLRVDTNADKLVKYIDLIKILGFEKESLIISKVEEILDKDGKVIK